MAELVTGMSEYFNEGEENWQVICHGMLTHLLALICTHNNVSTDFRLRSGNTESISRFLPVVDFIYKNLDQQIDMKELYDMSHMSHSQFSILFKEVFHVSASQFIQYERIRRAITLLHSSTFSISQICYLCGFNWVSHFNKAFKASTGLSPTAYRSRIQRSE